MRVMYSFLLILCLSILTPSSRSSSELTLSQTHAKKLFQRLSGLSLKESDPKLAGITNLIDAGKLSEAAHLATEEDSFYNLTIRDFAAPMSDMFGEEFVDFNDFIAMWIGFARDDVDARQLLSGNVLYAADPALGLPTPSISDNKHFQQMEANKLNFRKSLVRQTPQWADIPEAAGLLTTRAWANAHYTMGTNRRAVAQSFEQFLCRPIETLRDRTAPQFWIRRDVVRDPAGKPHDFEVTCSGCHSGMDALGGAFARFDYDLGRLKYFPQPKVAAKMNINNKNYSAGASVNNDKWENYWVRGANESIGWRTPTIEGRGIRAYGEMLANSRAFSQCLSKKAFQRVCRTEKVPAADIKRIADAFESSGYKLRTVFEQAALSNGCF